jgi:frataxin-like iron-binding protein CyaY
MHFVCREIFLEGDKLASQQDGQHFETPLSNRASWTHTRQADFKGFLCYLGENCRAQGHV